MLASRRAAGMPGNGLLAADMSRSRLVGLLVLLAMSFTIVTAQTSASSQSEAGETRTDRFWWDQPYRQRQGLIAVGGVQDSDGLRGFSLGYGTRGEGDESPVCGFVWLSRQVHDSERVVGLRGEMAMWVVAGDWGAIGPILGFGVETRDDEDETDFGALLPIGVEFTLWSRSNWQFSVDAERVFGISAETRNELRLSVAFAHDRLTPGSH